VSPTQAKAKAKDLPPAPLAAPEATRFMAKIRQNDGQIFIGKFTGNHGFYH